MPTNTIHLHRVLSATPERVYRAFLDADAIPKGVELNIAQEGVPDVIPPEACYLGWQESLTLLAKLVEADIPD